MTASLILLICFCVLLAAAAVQDVASRTISNWISVAVFGVGLVAVGIQVPLSQWWEHGLSFALTLAAGVFLFSKSWVAVRPWPPD